MLTRRALRLGAGHRTERFLRAMPVAGRPRARGVEGGHRFRDRRGEPGEEGADLPRRMVIGWHHEGAHPSHGLCQLGLVRLAINDSATVAEISNLFRTNR